MKIGIIVAMEKELKQLRSILTDVKEETIHGKVFLLGSVGGKDVVVQQCGIGKVNSTIGAVEMINNYAPDYVVSSGVAGGATVSVPRLEVVASTETVYHDVYCGSECEAGQVLGMPARFKCDDRLVEVASTIKGVHPGLIVSGDWFVDTKGKMGAILDLFPEAKAVDMESCSIAQVCHVYGVPFISFRVISDIPLDDTKGSQYFDFWDKVASESFAVTKEFIGKI